MATGSTWQRPDLVPLEDRLRFLQLFRLAGVLLAVVIAAHGGAQVSLPAVVGVGLVGLVGGLVARQVVPATPAGRWLFGIVLLGDGLLLVTLVHLLGGLGSPGRYLVVLHVLVVTLIASYRTGLKLAIWYALLILLLHEAGEIGWLRQPALDDPTFALFSYIGLIWTVALLTASASAVNEREILRRRYDLDAFARMSGALELVAGLHDVAGTIVEHICDTFDAPRGGIVSLRDGDPVMIAGRGLAPSTSAGEITGLLGVVRTQRRTVLVTRLGVGDQWLAGHLPGAEQVMLIPLAVDSTVGEVLVVEHGTRADRRLKRSTISTIERFAAHGALALRNARLHGELVAMARTDGLTGVANRAAFDQTLASELDRVARNGGSLGLVLCDLDHFKKLNDRYGHQVGDAALIEVARALREGCRSYDTVARYGGEEFAVIMPMTTQDTALRVAERLRAGVAAIAEPAPLTISIGVAAATHGIGSSALIAAADEALYRAKQEGRNRVAVTDLARPVGPHDMQDAWLAARTPLAPRRDGR